MRPSQEGLHRGATPPGAGQMRETLQHLAPPPSRRSATTSEEVYLSSLAPLLTTVVDMDVVVRGLSFPWAPGSSPGFAAVRRAFCQAVAALPGRTLKYTVSHRRLGF